MTKATNDTTGITVVNVRDVIHDKSFEYIGRGSWGQQASVLANVFYMQDESDRDDVIEKYRYWLWDRLSTEGDNVVKQEFERLYAKWRAEGELKLACWCAPKACHGDVLKSALGWYHKKMLTGK